MKKTTALLLGGTAALMSIGPTASAASANPAAQLPAARSYAELLNPIPDAVVLLKADDARLAQQPARVQLAQYHHHHHHHHHHGYFGLGLGVPYVAPYYGGPGGCYWTWSRPVWNGYRWLRRRIRVCN